MNYKSLASQLLLEDEQTDREYRQRAQQIFNALEQAIKSRKDDLLEPVKNKGYAVRGKYIEGLPDNLIFLLVDKNQKSGYAKNRGFNIVQINVLKGPQNAKYLETRLRGSKTDIIHELIHLFDRQRSSYTPKSAKKFDMGDVGGYYNEPEELNAYYQEAVERIESLLDNIDQSALEVIVKNYGQSFQDFKDWAIDNFFNDDFIDNLTNKNKRKVVKRLARWYQSRTEFN